MSRPSNNKKANGFTMSECLLALMTSVFLAMLLVICLQSLLFQITRPEDSQPQFALLQLRETAALARKARVHKGELILTMAKNEKVIQQDRNRLISRPGYEILLEGVKLAVFENRQGKIYLVVTDEKNRTRAWQVL